MLSDLPLSKMPRSNKKKTFLKPLPNLSMAQSILSPDKVTQKLLLTESNLMISRAISSARCHGFTLEHGSPNPGTGDCAFESVIQNNNDRTCFEQKFPLPVSYYRRMWVTDMANRTVDTDWNILSRKEWLAGWQGITVPGIYERGIFGDLMLPGIACGIRKLLLIFNTNPQSPHDPIYVVDPRQFNIEADSVVPIILAYNQYHYESLHPHSDADIQATVDLVVEYQDNRYRYSKTDFPLLLGLDEESQLIEERKDKKSGSEVINVKLGPSPSARKKQKLFESEFREEEESSNVKNNLRKMQGIKMLIWK